MDTLRKSLISWQEVQATAFNNTEEFEKFLNNDLNKLMTTLCGVQFNDDLTNKTEFPTNINISVR